VVDETRSALAEAVRARARVAVAAKVAREKRCFKSVTFQVSRERELGRNVYKLTAYARLVRERSVEE
jgi:hypothetical protein